MRWLGGLGERELLRAPSLALVEAVRTVGRVSGQPNGYAALDRFTWSRIHFWPLSEGLAQRAAEIAISCGLKGADAIYVALAADLDDVLVTFDREQLDRGASAAQVVEPA